MIGLWVAAWYVWLAPGDKISDRPLGSLTLKEITDRLFWLLVWLAPLGVLARRFINYKEEEIIEWETWGLFGLGLVAVATLAGLWLSFR